MPCRASRPHPQRGGGGSVPGFPPRGSRAGSPASAATCSSAGPGSGGRPRSAAPGPGRAAGPQTLSFLVSPSHLGDVRQGGEGWLHRRGCVCGGGRGRVGRRAEPSPGGKAVQAEAPAWARLMYLLWLEYRGGARTWAQEVRPLTPPEQMGHLSRERFGTGLEHREVGRGARGHSRTLSEVNKLAESSADAPRPRGDPTMPPDVGMWRTRRRPGPSPLPA